MSTPDLDTEMLAFRDELSEPLATLIASQKYHGSVVREQTTKAYGRLDKAHALLTGVLGAALLRTNGKIVPITATSEERNALFSSFIIGLKTSEDAIVEGRYLQAHALLRQEMEIVAQLKAVRAGKRNETRSPNIGALEKSLGRHYGELSAAAHVSKHELVRLATEWGMNGDDLPGPTSGTRQFPICDEGVARRSFSLHLMLMMNLIEELSIDLLEQHPGDAFTEREAEALNLATRMMQAEGMVTLF